MPRGRRRRRGRGAGQRRPATPGGPPLPPDVGGLPSRGEMGTWARQFGEQRTREGRRQFWGNEEARRRRSPGQAFRTGEEMAGRPTTPAPAATPGVPPATPTPTPTPFPRRSEAPVAPQVPLPWETPTPGEQGPPPGPFTRFFAPPGAPGWGQYIQQPRTVPGPQDWLPYQRNWYDDGGQYSRPPSWQPDIWRILPRQGWEFGWREPPPVDPLDFPVRLQEGGF